MRLTYRERRLFFGLVVFITVWILYALAIKPAIDRVDTLERVVHEKNNDLRQLRTTSTQYLAFQGGLEDLKRKADSKDPALEPLPYIESITKKNGLTQNIVAMSQEISKIDSHYSEAVVQVELRDLTLKQMLDFLLKISSSNHFLKIKSLYTNKNITDPDLIDTVIQISSIKTAQK